MIKIDAIGDKCPIPVIKTKNALKEIESGVLEVLVDNEISIENVEKMCLEKKLSYSIVKDNNIYKISIVKTNENKKENSEENTLGTVIVIDSDEMGKGDPKLGKALMKAFIYTLTELETLPETIILYNKGVFLAAEGSDSIEDLEKLSSLGVNIFSCGACVNFYELVEKVKIGSVTNMYNILNLQTKARRIIKP
ncbi:MAG: sulfurtransferase-like selenium metabolism protein YedF [Fusobacteriaceae bacterium]|nr:sulfurtransferase-like selenium metabolism protein YedF [Fusobacteriaceae bacterium]